MLISNKIHYFRNFGLQIYTFYSLFNNKTEILLELPEVKYNISLHI